jgi:hypothetical protein
VGSDYFQVGELLQQADVYTIASRGILRRLQRFFPIVPLNIPGFDFDHVSHCVQASSRPLSSAAQRILSLTTRILEQSRQDPQS